MRAKCARAKRQKALGVGQTFRKKFSFFAENCVRSNFVVTKWTNCKIFVCCNRFDFYYFDFTISSRLIQQRTNSVSVHNECGKIKMKERKKSERKYVIICMRIANSQNVSLTALCLTWTKSEVIQQTKSMENVKISDSIDVKQTKYINSVNEFIWVQNCIFVPNESTDHLLFLEFEYINKRSIPIKPKKYAI